MRTGSVSSGRQRGWTAAPALQPAPGPTRNRGRPSVKVIASSLRKGNIMKLDNKLYVVLNAESFHPGKGTPTTQVDMRRISDGVKVAQRFKTTEQVERAYVEDREHQFLYQDIAGRHHRRAGRLSPAGNESDAGHA